MTEPLQAYFRINAASFGQFERTLIIADEGSEGHYRRRGVRRRHLASPVCTRPWWKPIREKKGAIMQYTTVQNWYKNIYNLVTKKSLGGKGHNDLDGREFGSQVTMNYPGFILASREQEEKLSIALANKGQHLVWAVKQSIWRRILKV